MASRFRGRSAHTAGEVDARPTSASPALLPSQRFLPTALLEPAKTDLPGIAGVTRPEPRHSSRDGTWIVRSLASPAGSGRSDTTMLAARVRNKLLGDLLLGVSFHFIEGFPNRHCLRVKHPRALRATPAPESWPFNPCQFPAMVLAAVMKHTKDLTARPGHCMSSDSKPDRARRNRPHRFLQQVVSVAGRFFGRSFIGQSFIGQSFIGQ
jgi:hypothetical protein